MDDWNKHVDLARLAHRALEASANVAIYAAGGWYEIVSMSLNDDTFEVTFEGTETAGWFLYETLQAVRAR